MAKIGYRFNPDTLSYDKIEIPLRKKIGRLLRKFFSSLSLAVVIFFIVSAVIDSPKEKALRREKQEILAQYHLLNNEVSRLDAVLKNLEERDDNIYRVIFEAEPIDDAIRNPPPESGMRNGERYLSSIAKVNGKVVLNIDCEKFFQSDLRPY